MDTESKVIVFGSVKSVEDKVIVTASDFSIDRQGERVNPKGWLLKHFKKNPVMLIGHDYSSLPVGKWKNVKVEGNELIVEAQFASTEKAREVESLVRDGILNAVSVGFIVKKRNERDSFIIDEAELLEVSWVAVPANPNALQRAMAKGYTFSLDKTAEQNQIEDKNTALLAHYKSVMPQYRELLQELQKKNSIVLEGVVEEVEQVVQVLKTVTQTVEEPIVTQQQDVVPELEVKNSQPAETPLNVAYIEQIASKRVSELLSKFL